MTNTIPEMIKPSRWFYVIGIIILIVGLYFQMWIVMAVEIPTIQVIMPGSSNITLQQIAKYTIFFEYRSTVENRIYSTGKK